MHTCPGTDARVPLWVTANETTDATYGCICLTPFTLEGILQSCPQMIGSIQEGRFICRHHVLDVDEGIWTTSGFKQCQCIQDLPEHKHASGKQHESVTSVGRPGACGKHSFMARVPHLSAHRDPKQGNKHSKCTCLHADIVVTMWHLLAQTDGMVLAVINAVAKIFVGVDVQIEDRQQLAVVWHQSLAHQLTAQYQLLQQLQCDTNHLREDCIHQSMTGSGQGDRLQFAVLPALLPISLSHSNSGSTWGHGLQTTTHLGVTRVECNLDGHYELRDDREDLCTANLQHVLHSLYARRADWHMQTYRNARISC